MLPYRRTQTGYLIIGAAALALAFSFATAGRGPENSWWIVFIILVAVGIVFARLTVDIDKDLVQVYFTPGWPRWRWQIEGITSAGHVRNPWLAGWGIHWVPGFPGYWVINVSGFDAVELRLRNGRRYRIGTDDPRGVLAALDQAGVPLVQDP